MKHVLLIFWLLAFTASTSFFAAASLTFPAGNVPPQSAAQLYTKQCASCHGKDGRSKTIKGRLKHARDLTVREWQEKVSEERIFNSINNGKGKMPAFGKKLSQEQVESLVTHVRALKR